MKKKTLLTLCTAGTIVMTSAVSFAAWDQTESTSPGITVEVAKPVTVSMEQANITFTGKLASENSLNGGAASLTSSAFTVDVKNLSDDQAKTSKLKLTANGAPAGVKVAFESAGKQIESGTEVNYDAAAQYTMIVSHDGVADKDGVALKEMANKGTNLNLTVTAELVPAAN